MFYCISTRKFTEIILSHDDAVIQCITSCHKIHMTTHVTRASEQGLMYTPGQFHSKKLQAKLWCKILTLVWTDTPRDGHIDRRTDGRMKSIYPISIIRMPGYSNTLAHICNVTGNVGCLIMVMLTLKVINANFKVS